MTTRGPLGWRPEPADPTQPALTLPSPKPPAWERRRWRLQSAPPKLSQKNGIGRAFHEVDDAGRVAACAGAGGAGDGACGDGVCGPGEDGAAARPGAEG